MLRADEGGSAALEFIAVGVLLLVPIAYLVIALGTVQSHALGAEAAARFAARTIANDSASTPGETAAAVASQYGIDSDALDIGVSCAPAASRCPEAGAVVTVTVRAEAELPFVPPVLGLDRIARVPIEATAAHKVSRFGGAG
ncbi:TadE family protein [Microbacterium halophytorum]|uniref:TadE family protein n=1 Tax=Microbacterium halophytorum TaxID=2067568 RepID=UPI000CFB4A3C|nr:TadE family protein [Microbacterium halophytorum]